LISFYGLVGGTQKGWQSVTDLLLYARSAAHRSWIPGFRSASRNGSPGCGEPHAVRTLLILCLPNDPCPGALLAGGQLVDLIGQWQGYVCCQRFGSHGYLLYPLCLMRSHVQLLIGALLPANQSFHLPYARGRNFSEDSTIIQE
jgi:hypothetical protein